MRAGASGVPTAWMTELTSGFDSELSSSGFESERVSSGFESERVTGLSSADRSEAEGPPNRTVPSWLSAESENSERAKKELRVRTNLLAN